MFVQRINIKLDRCCIRNCWLPVLTLNEKWTFVALRCGQTTKHYRGIHPIDLLRFDLIQNLSTMKNVCTHSFIDLLRYSINNKQKIIYQLSMLKPNVFSYCRCVLLNNFTCRIFDLRMFLFIL